MRGHERIAAVIVAAHEQFPGFSFRLAGPVDGHHDTARFSWELVSDAEEGLAPVAGFDVITLDGEDRIRSVFGFLTGCPPGREHRTTRRRRFRRRRTPPEPPCASRPVAA